MALSPTRINALKPKTTPYEEADGGGLFIEILPSGAKVWRFRYRLNGRREKVTIGKYPDVPIASKVNRHGEVEVKGARDWHREYRTAVAAGRSPAREKQVQKARGSEDESLLSGFVKQRFVPEVVELQRRPKNNQRRLERHVLPTLGNRRLEEVEAGDLLSIIDTLKARGRIQEARHVLILTRSLFAHAIARQRIKRNPAAEIPMKLVGAAGQRERALTPSEIGKLLAAIARATFLNRAHRLALRLLLLTLCRKGELVAARWEHVDFEKGEWLVPASNQKSAIQHVVPLSQQALQLLGELRKLAGEAPYVLPNLVGRLDKPMAASSLNWALWQITKKRGDKDALLRIPQFTLHDLRRTGSTILHENGYVSDVIEKALGHTIKGVKGVYNKATYLDPRREMLQFWANYLDGLEHGKVVQLRAKGAA